MTWKRSTPWNYYHIFLVIHRESTSVWNTRGQMFYFWPFKISSNNKPNPACRYAPFTLFTLCLFYLEISSINCYILRRINAFQNNIVLFALLLTISLSVTIMYSPRCFKWKFKRYRHSRNFLRGPKIPNLCRQTKRRSNRKV